MMNKVLFNSVFENSLRILILLDELSGPRTVDMLYNLDFLSVYGVSLGISKDNLNGDNPYMFSEFAARRLLVQQALKELVLEGMALPMKLDSGIGYIITPDGEELATALDNQYAVRYRKIARLAIKKCAGKNEREIIAAINKKAAETFKRRDDG